MNNIDNALFDDGLETMTDDEFQLYNKQMLQAARDRNEAFLVELQHRAYGAGISTANQLIDQQG